MSQENVETVRREYAAFAARDWEALADLWHPDIEYEVLAGAGTFRGIDQVTRFFDSFSDMYSDYRVEAEEMLDVGDRVMVVERLSGRGLKGSDSETWIQHSFARLISFKEGRVWRVKEYPNRAEALEAAGLRE
jgi:ketosteroid isomerase-like protein